MKKLLALTLIALSFATGFTCSKQAQEETAAPPPAQEEMGMPMDEMPPMEEPPAEEPPPEEPPMEQ